MGLEGGDGRTASKVSSRARPGVMSSAARRSEMIGTAVPGWWPQAAVSEWHRRPWPRPTEPRHCAGTKRPWLCPGAQRAQRAPRAVGGRLCHCQDGASGPAAVLKHTRTTVGQKMRPPTVAAAAARLTAVHGLVACRGRTTGRNRAVRGVCRGSARRLRRLSAAGAARGEGEHVNGVLGLSTRVVQGDPRITVLLLLYRVTRF